MDDESGENNNDELAACERSNWADTLLPIDGLERYNTSNTHLVM